MDWTSYNPKMVAGSDPGAGPAWASGGVRQASTTKQPVHPGSPAPGYTYQPGWGDMTSPGVGEQFFQNTQGQYLPGASNTNQWWTTNQGQFSQPSTSEGFYSQYAPAFAAPGANTEYWNGVQGSFQNHPGVSNNSQGAYGDVKAAMPNLMADPGLGSYYNDAERRTTQALDQNFAARGAYGSSVSQGQVGDAVRGLEADRAKNEANYQLARSAEQRGWEGLGVQAAGQADTSSLNASKNNLDWLLGGGVLANNADKSALDRLMGLEGAASDASSSEVARLVAGMQGAEGADKSILDRLMAGQTAANESEGMHNDRAQGALNNINTVAGETSGLAGKTYGQMFDADTHLLDADLGAAIFGAKEWQNMSAQQQAQLSQDIWNTVNAIQHQPTKPGPANSPIVQPGQKEA